MITPTGPAWEVAKLERNWLIYRLVPRPDGKLAKLPAHPRTGTAPISVHHAACLTFDEAQAAATEHSCSIGYRPQPRSALVGIDLDRAFPPWDDEPEPWAADLLAYTYSWAERSPSGLGIRVIAERQSRSPVVDGEANGVGYFAAGGRFFTITLDLLPAGMAGRNTGMFARCHGRIYPEHGLIVRVV
jgi:primase-polymerase (primpol)-like protein